VWRVECCVYVWWCEWNHKEHQQSPPCTSPSSAFRGVCMIGVGGWLWMWGCVVCVASGVLCVCVPWCVSGPHGATSCPPLQSACPHANTNHTIKIEEETNNNKEIVQSHTHHNHQPLRRVPSAMDQSATTVQLHHFPTDEWCSGLWSG
jgi:hypothetical protein